MSAGLPGQPLPQTGGAQQQRLARAPVPAVEIAPWPRRAQANARAAGVEDKVEFWLGDMYAADVRPATVVTLFLHPEPNLKLRPKLRSELQAGSRVVSYIWDMGDWTPEEVRRVNRRQIFLWRIAAPAGVNTGLPVATHLAVAHVQVGRGCSYQGNGSSRSRPGASWTSNVLSVMLTKM